MKKLRRGRQAGLIIGDRDAPQPPGNSGDAPQPPGNSGDAPQPPGNSGDVVVCSAFCDSVPVVIKETIATFFVLLKVV
jgi:hypothetical protein